MALTATNLSDYELMLRREADSLRKAWPDNPADVPAVKQHGVIMRQKADAFDSVGDLLLAMQNRPEAILKMLRADYVAISNRLAPPEKKPETEEVEAA